MSKIRVLLLASLAVFAFGVITASSAFAAAEWLVGGAAFTGELLVETSGFLLLIHLAGGFLEPEAVVECTGIFDGFVLSPNEDLITEVLTLGGAATSLASPLLCLALAGCEKPSGGEDTEVAAENLPWLTVLELMEPKAGENLYLDLITEDTDGGMKPGLPAYEITCLVLGSTIETLCEGETSADLTNVAGGVLGVFNSAELTSEKLEALCEMGGTDHPEVGSQEGEGETINQGGGGVLSVSG